MSIMNYTEPLKYARYTPITCFQFMSQWKQEGEGLTCEICYRGYEEGQLQDTRPRGICYQCWYQHIKTFISQISYKAGSEIISPFEGRDPLDVCLALNTLRSEDAIELEEFLFKKYSSFTGDIEKCPSESCDFVFTMEQCRWGKAEEKCPKCEAVLSQANGLDFKSMIGFVYFLFLTNKCPKCEIPIEKTTGCPHMSCPCGHQFCWYCLKDYYPSPLNVYTVHEPKQCASIFISKIVYTCTCVAGIFLTLLGNEIFQKFMGYFFVGMAYLLHSLLLDIAIAINIFIINNLIVKHYNRLYSNPKSNKWMMGGLVAFDLIVVLLLYYFELLLDSAIILIAEVSIIGVIALIVWMVIITVDTWFNYIC